MTKDKRYRIYTATYPARGVVAWGKSKADLRRKCEENGHRVLSIRLEPYKI